MKRLLITAFLLCITSSCGQHAFLKDVTTDPTGILSGDIIIVSGGNVARTTTPFPLHQIINYSSSGKFKSILKSAGPTEFYMGLALSFDLTNLLYTIDTTDRVEKMKFSDPTNTGVHLLDTLNLGGNSMRTLATLTDGGTVVAESTVSIEKYDSTNARVTTNYPIVLSGNIMKVRKISAGRWVAITTGGVPDSPRVYDDAGNLLTTISLGGLACTTNCDPSDIVELSDGRFVVAVTAPLNQSLELFSSSFTYIGQLYKNTSIIQDYSAIAQLHDGSLLACSTSMNTCEKISISGSTGTRVGTTALISDASVMRQPTDILVVP